MEVAHVLFQVVFAQVFAPQCVWQLLFSQLEFAFFVWHACVAVWCCSLLSALCVCNLCLWSFGFATCVFGTFAFATSVFGSSVLGGWRWRRWWWWLPGWRSCAGLGLLCRLGAHVPAWGSCAGLGLLCRLEAHVHVWNSCAGVGLICRLATHVQA